MYSIQQHVDYHAWAAGRMAETLQATDEKILFEERKSSFGSIAKTILHMWDAEVLWLRRFEGESLQHWPSSNFTGGKKELIEGYKKSSTDVRSFCSARQPAELAARFKYKTTKGEPFEDTIEDMLYHIVNHGSYHRGQVVTMLHEAGVSQILSMDIVIYLRSLNRL